MSRESTDRLAEVGLPSAWHVRPFADEPWPTISLPMFVALGVGVFTDAGRVAQSVVLAGGICLTIAVCWLFGMMCRNQIRQVLGSAPEHVVEAVVVHARSMLEGHRTAMVFARPESAEHLAIPLRASVGYGSYGQVRVVGDLAPGSLAVPVVDGVALWPVGRIHQRTAPAMMAGLDLADRKVSLSRTGRAHGGR